MVDAVNPASIPAEYNGCPAVRISVLAAPGADAYDLEDGNAPPAEVAPVMASAVTAGRPVVAYVNETTLGELAAALALHHLAYRPATDWPAAGVYLWVAYPSNSFGRIPSWAPVAPVAVQDRYLHSCDLSTTYGPFPGRVAGYVDGKFSAWPAAAWDRFIGLQAAPTDPPGIDPASGGGPGPNQGDDMALSDADVAKVMLAFRQEMTPGSELFDRVVQAAMQAIKETPPDAPPAPVAPAAATGRIYPPAQ